MSNQNPPPSGQFPQQPGNQQAFQPGYAPPPKKKHTVRNVLLIVIAVLILLVGGCFALIGGAANEVSKNIDKHENQKGGSNNPITLKHVGDPFTIGDTAYSKGWKLEKDVLDQADVSGLSVTNKGSDSDYPSIEFRLWRGKTMLAEIDCGLLEEVPAGTSQKLKCSGNDPLPKHYDRLTVQNAL